jgi:glutaredoxin
MEVFIMSMVDKYTKHVEGENRGRVLLFTLSNCTWCRQAKELLNTWGIEYDYVDVDLTETKDRLTLMEAIEEWDPACIFPTVIVNGQTCFSGCDKYKMKQVLKTALLNS